LVGQRGERVQVGGLRAGVQGGIGQEWAADRVEQDVVGSDSAMSQPGAMEVVHRLGQRCQDGDQLAVGQSTAAVEECAETPCGEELTDQDPVGFGLAYLDQPCDVWVADAGQHAQVFAEPPVVGKRADR
jgi:hypothetical protein